MRLRGQDGFTLMEALVALVILGFVMLGVQAMITDRLIGQVARHDVHATANQLAADRLHAVQTAVDYAGLAGAFAGSEARVDGHPGFRRTTQVAVAPGLTTVTVRVVTPGGQDTVSRTRAIGAP